MKTLTHNSPEFIKANIYYAQDGSTACIHSIDICNHLTDASDRDEAFNEAVEFITDFLKDYKEGEYEEDGNNGCSQTWNKK
jgi:hypothetical protein